MSKKHRKILVINNFGIGDVLFTTPMLRALKENMPESRIDFMCNRRCVDIVRNNKNVNDVFLFEKDEFREAFKGSKIGGIKKVFSFSRALKFKKYDIAIDLSLGYQISLLLKLMGVGERLGLNYRNRGRFLTQKLDVDGFETKHVVEYYLDILRLLGIRNAIRKDLELDLPANVTEWANGFCMKNTLTDKLLIGVAPGGGKSWGEYAIYRRWDPENFSHVALELLKENKEMFVLILGSEDEKGICSMIHKKLGEKAINLCGKLPLLNSIALIGKCKLLLCNDGGMLHAAVSQRVSTISIFGPVNDTVYGPCSSLEKHRVVKAENVQCRPCYRRFKPKVCTIHDCLKKIDRNQVLELARRTLRGYEPLITDRS